MYTFGCLGCRRRRINRLAANPAVSLVLVAMLGALSGCDKAKSPSRGLLPKISPATNWLQALRDHRVTSENLASMLFELRPGTSGELSFVVHPAADVCLNEERRSLSFGQALKKAQDAHGIEVFQEGNVLVVSPAGGKENLLLQRQHVLSQLARAEEGWPRIARKLRVTLAWQGGDFREVCALLAHTHGLNIEVAGGGSHQSRPSRGGLCLDSVPLVDALTYILWAVAVDIEFDGAYVRFILSRCDKSGTKVGHP